MAVDSLWVMDHFFQILMIGPPEHEMLEGYSALAYAAGVTRTITLGTLVTGVTYRHPGLLLKTVTTLDVLSGGRAWLGIGAAWNEEEHRGLGVPYPGTSERFERFERLERLERLEETLQIAARMWAGDDSPFEGEHYRLQRPLNSPAALSRPHPPILLGPVMIGAPTAAEWVHPDDVQLIQNAPSSLSPTSNPGPRSCPLKPRW